MSYISEKKEKFRKDAEISRQKELTRVTAERQRLEQVKKEKDAISENKARIREIRTEKVRKALKGFQQFTNDNQKRAKMRQSTSPNNPFSPSRQQPQRENYNRINVFSPAPSSSLILNSDPPGNRNIGNDFKGSRAVNRDPKGGVFGSSPLRQSQPRQIQQKKKGKTIIIRL